MPNAELDVRTNLECEIDCRHDFFLELKGDPDPTSVSLSQDRINPDVRDLVHDAFVRGVAEESIPLETERLEVRIEPAFDDNLSPPFVKAIHVELTAITGAGAAHHFAEDFEEGRWKRRLATTIAQLREEGTLETGQSAYQTVVAMENPAAEYRPVPLQMPTIEDDTLETFGIEGFEDGSFTPDRPILFNKRMHDEMIRRTEAIGTEREMGTIVLGKYVRLPEPLPQTSTRIVTVLSTFVDDERIVGTPSECHFPPEALAAAVPIAQARGRGERAITILHSHLWGCGECNHKTEGCPLVEATTVSPKDYQLLESLFGSRITPFPITGRIVGRDEKRPCLAMNVWRGGTMRPVRYRLYRD